MGSAVSNNIFYENVNKETQSKLLEEFKKAYSGQNVKHLHVHRGELFRPYYIYVNNVSVNFTNETSLIDFICELERPFVFSNSEELCISFVYSKST